MSGVRRGNAPPERFLIRLTFKLGASFRIDEGGDRVRKFRERIIARRRPLRFDEHRPTRSEPAKGVIEPAGHGDEL